MLKAAIMNDPSIEVSVVIPAYNADRFIGQAIRSVLDQTFPDFELIVIDDGSTDATNRIVRGIRDPRVRLIEHKRNMGLCTSRNDGMRAAAGRWIAPMDADDTWHKDRLAKLLAVARDHRNAFVGSDLMLCFSGDRNELIPWRTLFDVRGIRAQALHHVTPADFVKHGLSVLPMFPADIVRDRNIVFVEEYKGHDWLCFLFELFGCGLELVILNEPLYYYRISSGSDSTSYESIATQMDACAYLSGLPWIDRETRSLIRKSGRVSKHRLFTIALREKRWSEALQSGLRDPLSFVYALKRLPSWALRQRTSRRLRKRASSANAANHDS